MTQTSTATHRAGTPGNVRHSVDKARMHLRDIETAIFDVRAHAEEIAGPDLDRFTDEALSAARALTHTLETLRYSAGFEIFDRATGERIKQETSADLWGRLCEMNDTPPKMADLAAALLAAQLSAPLADFEPEEDSHGRLEVVPLPVSGSVVFPPFAGWGDVKDDCRPVFRADDEGPNVPDINLPRLEPMAKGWGVVLLGQSYRVESDALKGFEDGMRLISLNSSRKPATAHPIT